MEHTIDIKTQNLKYFSIVVISTLLLTLLSYFLPVYKLSLVLFLLTLTSTIAGLIIVKNVKSKNNNTLTATQLNDLKIANTLLLITLIIFSVILIITIGLIVYIGINGFGR